MITVDDILKKAKNKYIAFLQSKINKEVFFPLVITGNKTINKDATVFKKEIDNLYTSSKENKGYGYTIIYDTIKKKGLGTQSIPKQFLFEKEEDYLMYLKKEKEVVLFQKKSVITFNLFPELKELITKKPMLLIKNVSIWDNILKVCTYFKANPSPNHYIRELPVKVHTKFIEKNKTVLKELLDVILKDNVNPEEKKFEKRFGLKYAEPQIRFKILDKDIAKVKFSGITDLAIPLSDFHLLDLALKRILIVENKTSLYTTLTLPNMSKTIAIFGQGYGVSNLKSIEWFTNKEILYWGDFDAHGFEILSQVRSYYSKTKSVLMDKETFFKFNENDKGSIPKIEVLEHLNEEENILYDLILKNNHRLEQEKIPNDYVINYFKSF